MTNHEHQQLVTQLASPAFADKAMSLDRLQGFLCAVISSPDPIDAARWMSEALGIESEYDAINQVQDIAALLMDFHDQVEDTLRHNRPLELILQPSTTNATGLDYQTWCEGYILGWALSTREWLERGNEPLKKLTFPILYLSGAFTEDAARQGKQLVPSEEDKKIWRECADVLPRSVSAIYNFWQAKQRQAPITRDHPKVGRNELCPCGSGRKFKLCCGKSRTLH